MDSSLTGAQLTLSCIQAQSSTFINLHILLKFCFNENHYTTHLNLRITEGSNINFIL